MGFADCGFNFVVFSRAMKVRRLGWNSRVSEIFAPVLGSDEIEMRMQIQQGIAEIWQLDTLFLITRIEESELVVCCAIGQGLKELAPLINRAAKQKGCKTIRFHSTRPALSRLLKVWKFRELERVYQMEVAG